MNTIISQIAENCEWRKRLTNESVSQCDAIISDLEKKLPHEEAIGRGCKIDVTHSGEEQVIIIFDYHHKNEQGIYIKWSTHKMTVRPAFKGLNIKIAGAKQYGLEELLCELFNKALLKSL